MNLPWLARGLFGGERRALVARHLGMLGWCVKTKGRWHPLRSLSWANPFTCTVALSYRMRSGLEEAAVLAHEAAHARQFGGPCWRRWWRGLVYFGSRRRRLAWEVEARAHGAAVWLAAGAAPDYDAGALAGWRWPYFTGADAGQVSRAVEAQAEALVSGPVSGLSGRPVSG